MKKGIVVLVSLIVLGLFTVASAFDFEGTIGVGAFFDYGIGVGDNFDDIDFGTYTGSNEMTFSFGGQFMYGITSNIAISALVDYQQIKFTYDGTGAPDDPDAENYIVINLNGMYFFGTESQIVPFIEAGGGYYIPSPEGADSKFGVNGGVGALYFFQENMAVELGGRFHLIFDSESVEGGDDTPKTTYLDFRLGFKYFFGGME